MSTVAERIIEKCGGADKVAALLGLHPSAVYRWQYPAVRGGTGGSVPTGRQQELLDRAREAGIDLQPDDFFARPSPSQEDGRAA